MDTNASQLPVRGNDAVEILVNDHQIIKTCLSALVQAAQSGQRKSALDQLKAVLTIHNATEENLIYPALEIVGGKKSESQHLYHETSEADVLVFQLDTMLKEGNESDYTAKAQKLQKAVLEHIDDEENSAFPALQKGAQPQQSRMLTDSVREFRNSLRISSTTQPRVETGQIGSSTTTPSKSGT
ncbi:MAG: hemerythrin domain-containing protein [Candidatus Eremiobacteraeota bacterium]|nr:hemerythrin domain-containing protein [Candidatus Eremiobacteraeota bacterium]